MPLLDELLPIEEELWRAAGNRDLYSSHAAADAVHVFPGWGVSDLPRVLDAVESVAPWDSFELEDVRALALGPDAAALVYTARASRGGEPYVAAMTTVYRREGGTWKLVLHQQTPLS
jgi:hypothetical protein